MIAKTKQLGGMKKWVQGCLGAFGLVVILFLAFFGKPLYSLYKAGFLAPPPEKVGWTPETEKNLHVLYTGIMHVHDSDGTFPKSPTWMDKVITRVRTETLKKGAEKEKFVDPAAGGKSGEYGFAMNDVASGKYIDDIKDKKTPLIFQSTDSTWNAHGDPAKIGRKGGIGVAVDGSVVKL